MNKHQDKKRKRYHYTGLKIVLLLCVSIGLLGSYVLSKNNKREISSSYKLNSNQLTPLTQTISTTPEDEMLVSYTVSSDLHINSKSAVLMDLERTNILFEKNAEKTIYPASMTKIMTAVIVLEQVDDLNKEVLLDNDIFESIYEQNASIAGFLPGERVRVIDLLYGLLLPSGAECSVGLAQYVAGSEKEFVSLMNSKAKELGMSGTNFTNTTGLHDKKHYSTVADIAVLFKYALENSTFYEVITSAKHSTPPTNRHDGGITYYSTLLAKIDSSEIDGGLILGGKTGYTEEAGQCLASLAEKDGVRFILVTSGAYSNNKQQNLHIDDAIMVYTSLN